MSALLHCVHFWRDAVFALFFGRRGHVHHSACAGQETSPSIDALRVWIQSLDISPPHLQKIMLTSVWLLLFKSHCIRNSNDWQTTSNALGPTVSRVFAYLCLTTWRCQLQQQQQHLPVAQSLMKCICRTTGSRIHRDTLREEKTPCCSLIRVTLLRRKLLDRRRLRSWVSQGTAAESEIPLSQHSAVFLQSTDEVQTATDHAQKYSP